MWGKIRLLLILAFILVIGVVLIGWWANRISPADVRAYSLNDLHSVKVCPNRQCVDLDRGAWAELVERVGRLESTWNVGRKGEESTDLFYVEFDWGNNGTFGLRLWTRSSIKGNVIATFQREYRGGTSFYGDYSAKELNDWIERQAQSGNL